MQNRRSLPVYSGRRYQRGGGILSSIARLAMPVAKKLAIETAKATPGVLNSIIHKKSTPGAAICHLFEINPRNV